MVRRFSRSHSSSDIRPSFLVMLFAYASLESSHRVPPNVGASQRSSERHIEHALEGRQVERLVEPMDVASRHEIRHGGAHHRGIGRHDDDWDVAQRLAAAGGVDDLEPALLLALRVEPHADDDQLRVRGDELVESGQRTRELDAFVAQRREQLTQQVREVGVVVDDGGTRDGGSPLGEPPVYYRWAATHE